MSFAQKQGYLLENNIHSLISRTKCKIFNENEIVRMFGITCYGIDHLIETNDFDIFIQDKWTNTKPSLQMIRYFIGTVQTINLVKNKPCYAIYLSKLPISSNALKAFFDENIKQSIVKFISFSDENMSNLMYKLSYWLYSNKIYYYDDSGDESIIMLSEDIALII